MSFLGTANSILGSDKPASLAKRTYILRVLETPEHSTGRIGGCCASKGLVFLRIILFFVFHILFGHLK